ncbi:Protein CBG00937 [Caenorhabditis briggsae]|uniref:Protein CBG00937 n=1 Tax=Caenorhabditis briggsae TaxID=6238 RepID=A8WPA3_CAEBR|nr:Protein CBG00937 [Caenorhabditis briggsae]CAP22309.2 Protein CBG00937 [Caenorhabditis briggsae]
MVGNVYIGANVKQRAQLGENYLDGVEVLAVNGRKNIGMIAQILKDHGANVVEFRWSLENIGEISRRIRRGSILLNVRSGSNLNGSRRPGTFWTRSTSNCFG